MSVTYGYGEDGRVYYNGSPLTGGMNGDFPDGSTDARGNTFLSDGQHFTDGFPDEFTGLDVMINIGGGNTIDLFVNGGDTSGGWFGVHYYPSTGGPDGYTGDDFDYGTQTWETFIYGATIEVGAFSGGYNGQHYTAGVPDAFTGYDYDIGYGYAYPFINGSAATGFFQGDFYQNGSYGTAPGYGVFYDYGYQGWVPVIGGSTLQGGGATGIGGVIWDDGQLNDFLSTIVPPPRDVLLGLSYGVGRFQGSLETLSGGGSSQTLSSAAFDLSPLLRLPFPLALN